MSTMATGKYASKERNCESDQSKPRNSSKATYRRDPSRTNTQINKRCNAAVDDVEERQAKQRDVNSENGNGVNRASSLRSSDDTY